MPIIVAMETIAVIFVGNRLMLDDGVAPLIYDELVRAYRFPAHVALFDAACMSLDLLHVVRDFDVVIAVDAMDGTEEPAGTVLKFAPEDIAGRAGAMQSLHELRLVDLLHSAVLLGFEAEGVCFGVQVENASPSSLCEGLTEPVAAARPILRDAVLAELVSRNVEIRSADGTLFARDGRRIQE